ncbi:MAG TPA: DUF6379 domain-containing protein [Terriglobales bacterium]|nr:DUF6379 domain-containing protein [Terriglobales bacterium]
MLTNAVISDNGLRVAPGGLEVDIRLPWYRALPLSTVDIGEVRINGEVIQPASMKLRVNGKDFRLEQLENQTQEVWFVLDSAYLHIDYPKPSQGTEYLVEVTVFLRPPYIPGLIMPAQAKKRLLAN